MPLWSPQSDGNGVSGVSTAAGPTCSSGFQGKPETPDKPSVQRLPNRFYGKKTIKWMTMSSEAGKVQEALSRLFGLVGAEVEISLDIHVKAPKGIDQDVQRVIRETCTDLKFDDYGIEEE